MTNKWTCSPGYLKSSADQLKESATTRLELIEQELWTRNSTESPIEYEFLIGLVAMVHEEPGVGLRLIFHRDDPIPPTSPLGPNSPPRWTGQGAPIVVTGLPHRHVFFDDSRVFSMPVLTVYGQCLVGDYRADFLVQYEHPGSERKFVPLQLIVECDGHDYHDRTKEQAQRDKARDRTLQSHGLPVLRFTGSEIHRDPRSCARSVLTHLTDWDYRNFEAETDRREAERGPPDA